MIRIAVQSVSVIALLSAATMAQAQERATLRIGDYMAGSHYLVESGLKPWMQEVTAATNGQVAFEHFPSQQLGKAVDLLRLTQTNVAQISSLTVSMAGDKLELSGAAELPGMFTTSCQGTAAYMKAAQSGPIAEEFAANGVRLLYPIVFRSFQMFSRSKPIEGLASVSGQKMMVPMRPTELMLSKAGAVTQRLTSGPDTFQAVQRGTIDAFIFNPDSIYIYDMQNHVKHATENGTFGQLLSLYLINLQTWNKFDAATKAAIDAASQKAAKSACTAIDDGFVKVFERMRKDGVQVTVFSTGALATFAAAGDDASKQWAEDLAKRGKRGAEVLAAMRAAAGS